MLWDGGAVLMDGVQVHNDGPDQEQLHGQA